MAKKKNLRDGNSFWTFFGFGDAVRFVLGRNYPSKNIPGFTLIELLIAIAIIGVLASSVIMIMNPVAQFAKARDAQRKNDLEQIRNALDTYYNDYNKYPSDGGVGKIDGINWGDEWLSYMAKLPKDPSSSQNYRYESPVDGSSYRLYAKLERCSDSQSLPGVDCLRPENYSINSSNLAMIPTSTPIPPTPTPTLPPKKVFVTSNGYNGNLGGLIGADGKCQTLADAVMPGRVWKAWLSSSTESAASRLSSTIGTYFLVDGALIANNWADLINNKSGKYLRTAIVKTQNNGSAYGYVWSNTKPDGSINMTTLSNTCNDWTSPDIGNSGYMGNSWDVNGNWTNSGGNSGCNSPNRLYCFEQ